MKTFRTYQLAKEFYQCTKAMALRGDMRDQFDRAALSVVLNLAEGSAKPTVKDRKKFYFIAFGSLRECQSILELVEHRPLIGKADVLAAHLYRLCHS